MTEQEEKEKLDHVRKHNSYTSPSIEDVDICNDNTCFWDCWNADYWMKRSIRFTKGAQRL